MLQVAGSKAHFHGLGTSTLSVTGESHRSTCGHISDLTEARIHVDKMFCV